MSAIDLRLFGPPVVLREGVSVRLDRKPLALLAYLAVTCEPAGRANLADLLWPDAGPGQAQANVRKAVWAVKALAGSGALTVEPAAGTVRLGPGIAVDVDLFEAALARARRHGHPAGTACPDCAIDLSAAVALVHGEFMAGFGLRDSPDFDDWQLFQADRLRQAYAMALDDLADVHAATGQLGEALALAQRRLALDALHEPAHRRVMALLARMGQRAEALHQFERCRAALRAQLGLDVEPATAALRDAILTDAVAGRPAAADSPRSGVPGVPLSERLVVAEPPLGQRGLPFAAGGRRRARQDLVAAVLDPSHAAHLSPDTARRVAAEPPHDLDEYLVSRIAEWCSPRHRLDERFVELGLLVDRGETATTRWVTQGQYFGDLARLLASRPEPAVVVLGPPGCGKSTLLRRLELTTAAARLERRAHTVPFYESLAAFGTGAADPGPEPWAWLQARWTLRYPHLPPLDALRAEGRLLLLLDGLNEMPHRNPDQYRSSLGRWRSFLAEIVAATPGVRVVFTCRSLNYSAPLSSANLPVPQAHVERLSDDKVQAFLVTYAPDRAADLWLSLSTTGRLDAFRRPYLLRLLAEETADPAAPDLAALFTAFVRNALDRELAAGHRSLGDPSVLNDRDACQVTQRGPWRDAYDLPGRGALVPALEGLAWAMQGQVTAGESAGVRLPPAAWRAALGPALAEPIVTAGVALGLLADDLATDEVSFRHQLLQEYFAARRLAAAPEWARLAAPWRAAEVVPDIAATLAAMPANEALPPLAATGWEEVAVLATALCADPDGFVRDLAAVNLPLAGRCAAAAPGVSIERRAATARALMDLARAPAADLRARIAAGLALGRLGDPRLVRGHGPDGAFLLGPLAPVAAGAYPIGDDKAIEYLGQALRHHSPRHVVPLGAFRIGRFAVTNAEFACFLSGGGYEDDRWWDTPLARAWRRGEGTAEGHREAVRYWWRWFRDDPELVETQHQRGEFSDEQYDLWRRRLTMDAAAIEAHLRESLPDEVLHEPRYWRDPAWNNPAQPAVGISWVEARAYCRWLAAQSGLPVRLPSEVEWEAAARGPAGRRYGRGDDYGLEIGNTQDLRIRRTTPVGVFPAGDSPDGVADLTGNTWDWTLSLWGPDMRQPAFRYPYDPADGREAVDAPVGISRVVRGGAWVNGRVTARADYRGMEHPFDRTNLHGFRLVIADGEAT